MPTYNAAAVSDTTIAYQKPITLQQGRAFRDNLIATMEMASGSPKMKRKLVGGAATGSGSVTFTGLGEFGGVDMLINLSGSTGGAPPATFTLTLEFSNDGTTWLGGSTIFTDTGVSSTEQAGMRVWVDFDAATFHAQTLTYATGTATNASLSAISMRVRSSGSGGLDFSVSANFNGGIA
jgi:hypothetical protein